METIYCVIFSLSAASSAESGQDATCMTVVPDPIPGGEGGKVQAIKQGISLIKKDFLLYMATARGGKAKRNLMIRCLIDSLKNLKPTEDITKACNEAHNKITKLLDTCDPCSSLTMVPKYEYTLTKNFYIAQDFSKLQ